MCSWSALGVVDDSGNLQRELPVLGKSRELQEDRAYRSYNDKLNCVISETGQNKGLKFFPFEFWFATEADSAELNFLPDLETQIFNAVSSHVLWCYGRQTTTDFGGRRLTTKEMSHRKQEMRLLRRLGVVSVSSGAFDVATEGTSTL